jgi:outer membrane protein
MTATLLALTTAITTILLPAAHAEKGDLLVRARVIGVLPQGQATTIQPALPMGSVEVQNAVVPELDFTYFLSDRLALELILATSPHDLEGSGAIEGLGEVADIWALPPTLSLQYHFRPEASFRPYVGFGLNYTIFYEEEASESLNAALGETDIDLDDSFGVAFQVGADYDLNETWFLNADAKFITMDTEATLTSGDMVNTIQVDINPLVLGIGIGRRF